MKLLNTNSLAKISKISYCILAGLLIALLLVAWRLVWMASVQMRNPPIALAFSDKLIETKFYRAIFACLLVFLCAKPTLS